MAVLFIILLSLFKSQTPSFLHSYIFGTIFLIGLTLTISLLVSFYIYDISELYKFNWLPDSQQKSVLNINAGFDETSSIIKNKYPNCNLTICDFYNPAHHTEVSIKRARKAYPPVANTIQVTTDKLPFLDNSFDYTVAMLAAHEIREEKERVVFFKELNRVTKKTGQIFITEHLRDWTNFMAYTIGFFHFHSRSSWLNTFKKANLKVKQEIKITPFITTFVVGKHGNTF